MNVESHLPPPIEGDNHVASTIPADAWIALAKALGPIITEIIKTILSRFQSKNV